MGVYKNGYSIMLEPYAGSFEAYIVLLKDFILNNTPWTLDEDNSTETELYFDTGYEILYISPYSGNIDRMNMKLTKKYGDGATTGSIWMDIKTTFNNVNYSTCGLYAFVKTGLTIWTIHPVMSSTLPYTLDPDNVLYDYIYGTSNNYLSYVIGVCQVEFEDIINNRIAQTRSILYTKSNAIFYDSSISAEYQLEDGTWNSCYIGLFNYYNQSGSNNSLSGFGDKIYKNRIYVHSYSSPYKILGFIPQLCYMIRPARSIPRIYYPFKNGGYTYQYISYPICYVEKESE